jgi:tRNA threonylcarbamoyl adenosine modification protein (Sua5/YciO/YrdC/YwlC family)
VAVTAGAVEAAAEAALAGALIVFPTDTVYGIGTRPDRPEATARLFRAKARDRDTPLPVLVHSLEAAREVAAFDERAERLAAAFWPGALTLILPRTAASSAWDLGGDGATMGLRIPAHRVASALLAATGPLATSSANRSGDPPATTCADVRRTFGDLLAAYLCADDPLEGAASTVVDLAHGAAALVRRGELAPEEIERFLPRGEALLDSPPSP